MFKSLGLAVTTVMIMAVPAGAAVLTYKVNGTFVDGSLLGGHFSFDDTGGSLSQFSDIAVTVTGTAPISATSIVTSRYHAGGGTSLHFRIGLKGVSDDTAGLIYLGFAADYTSGGAVRAIIPSSLITGDDEVFGSSFNKHGIITYLASGTITAAAVPEPASWAMFVVGFGSIGAGMRRRLARIDFA